MRTGKFITIEGLDGAGKTTHMAYIENRIRDAGMPLVSTREPGGTELGERIRTMLLDRGDLSIGSRSELMLIFASRIQHIEQVVGPALDAGTWVLCDRFTDATYAYQGGGRAVPESRIRILEEWVQEGLQPDLTLLFDATLEFAAQRTRSRGTDRDHFERQGRDFKLAVRQQYLERADRFPGRIKVIDSNGSIKDARCQIDRALAGFDQSFAGM